MGRNTSESFDLEELQTVPDTDSSPERVEARPDASLHWRSSPRTLLRSVLMLDDSQHSIALGSAIGIGIGMTPTVGVQMIIVGILALLTRRLFYFNRVAACVGVYISNPVTMVPIYYFLYWMGTFFVAGHVTRDQFQALLEYEGFAGWWNTVCGLVYDLGTPLLIGTLVVAPISGILTYPVMRILLKKIRPHAA